MTGPGKDIDTSHPVDRDIVSAINALETAETHEHDKATIALIEDIVHELKAMEDGIYGTDNNTDDA